MMEPFYILKVNLILIAFWGFYRLLLRGQTFYQLNRLVLLLSLLAAIIIPVLPVPAMLEQSASNPFSLAHTELTDNQTGQSEASFTWQDRIWWVYSLGVGVFSLRFILQLLSVLRLWKTSRPQQFHGMRIRSLKGNQQPFSFGNQIFLYPPAFPLPVLSLILRHEQVHVRQGHTFDILLAEVVKILCWFNPVSWWLKRDVQLNLEFIADHALLSQGIDKSHYQKNLLKVIERQPLPAVASYFTYFNTKSRIAMMNKANSNPMSILRYVLILPLLATMLLACGEEEVPAAPEQTLSLAEEMDKFPADAQIFLDGKEVERAALEKLPAEGNINIEVKKTEAGTQVQISTQDGEQVEENLSGELASLSDDALFILDGREVAASAVKSLKPEEIKLIKVMKGDRAVEKYGDKAAKGVVYVELH